MRKGVQTFLKRSQAKLTFLHNARRSEHRYLDIVYNSRYHTIELYNIVYNVHSAFGCQRVRSRVQTSSYEE